MDNIVYLNIVFLPLLSFIVLGLLGPFLKTRLSNFISCLLLGVSCLCAWIAFFKVVLQHHDCLIPLFTWIEVGNLEVVWALNFNSLTTVMATTVTTVSWMVHLYSVGYMDHDKTPVRFMAYLGLFTFMMLILVMANDLVQLFFGWEGVGLASYLLIGYWYDRPSANAAAIKAFIVNRVGDLGLVLGIAGLFFVFKTMQIDHILFLLSSATEISFTVWGIQFNALEVIALALFVGAMGKSAQLGLHTWLPDAMEGPTPVSALIHAATMVTAGVFLLARLSPLYELAPLARSVVVVVGGLTAFFAGTVAITQNDIKRVIAYSTCSQLGYMFLAAGLSAYNASIFHLVTHAFFKALLFLGAGAVIHALSDEQDMRKMGGIWKSIPVTFAMMMIGSLALTGIPFFSGFYSKEAILEAAYNYPGNLGRFAYLIGIGSVLLTGLYAWRLIFMTFTGKTRADEKVQSHLHEPGLLMLIPLFVLCVGAIFVGLIGNSHFLSSQFWSQSLVSFPYKGQGDEGHTFNFVPLAMGLLGMLMAFILYNLWPKAPEKITKWVPNLYKFLLQKWYFDELYHELFVKPAKKMGQIFWKKGDDGYIDGIGPDGMARLVLRVAGRFSSLQSGYIYHYAFVMVLGLMALIAWCIF
jgi:NADH-quinone oxidoreductase subunit L